MSNYLYLVHVKDIRNNKVFIYDTNFISESQVESVFNAIFQKFKSANSKLVSSNHEGQRHTCSFYEESSIVKKGWFWNTVKTNKNILYVLNIIPLLCSTPEKMSIGLQFDSDTIVPQKTHASPVPVSRQNLFGHHGYARNFLFPEHKN